MCQHFIKATIQHLGSAFWTEWQTVLCRRVFEGLLQHLPYDNVDTGGEKKTLIEKPYKCPKLQHATLDRHLSVFPTH